jgi:hypothetical protein
LKDIPRACLFCGKELARVRAREHVFPRWLLNELNIGEEPINPTQFRPSGEVVSTREHLLENLQEGRVCATCNNGWMSKLEVDARPLLRPLMEGTGPVTDLTQEERAVVARWAVKTAYMLNSATNYDYKIPKRYLAEFYANHRPVPNGVCVFAQLHHANLDFYWLQGAYWPEVSGDEALDIDPSEATISSYKVTLQLRHLLLLVACWPYEGWGLTLWRGIHVPLWPQSGPCFHFELDPFPWNDSIQAVAEFHRNLRVKRFPPADGLP